MQPANEQGPLPVWKLKFVCLPLLVVLGLLCLSDAAFIFTQMRAYQQPELADVPTALYRFYEEQIFHPLASHHFADYLAERRRRAGVGSGRKWDSEPAFLAGLKSRVLSSDANQEATAIVTTYYELGAAFGRTDLPAVPGTNAAYLFCSLFLLCLTAYCGRVTLRTLGADAEGDGRFVKWFGAATVVAGLAAGLCLASPVSLGFFGVPLYLLLSLMFDLILLGITLLAYYLYKRPEQWIYLDMLTCAFCAVFGAAVGLSLLLNLLDFPNVFGASLWIVAPDTGRADVVWPYHFFQDVLRTYPPFYIAVALLVAVPLLVVSGNFVWWTALCYHQDKFMPMATEIIGGIKMKVFNNGQFVEEENEQPESQSLARIEPQPFSSLAKYGEQPSTGFGLMDRLRSKVGSTVQQRILEDQTKVTEAQVKALEAQKKVMDRKVGLVKTATEGQRAKNEYELLPEERRVKEMTFQVSQSELELQKLKLEAEKKKLEQMMNGTYTPEPAGMAEMKEARQKDKHYKHQSYMAETEGDSITARCQALDDWYEEKQVEIMGNQRLDAARRRQQLDVLDKEYKLRKKQLDDFINALLEAQEDGKIQV